MRSLTEKQRSVLDFIEKEIRLKKQPPTIKEVARHIGSENTRSGLTHLEALIRKGYLERSPGQARSIRLTGAALTLFHDPADGQREIPCFAGWPPSGGAPDFLPVSPVYFTDPPDYALKVGAGRSLPEAGIQEGDILFVQKTPARGREGIIIFRDPSTGELLPGFLARRKDRFLLRSPTSETVEQEVRKSDIPSLVQGRVVALFRPLPGPRIHSDLPPGPKEP